MLRVGVIDNGKTAMLDNYFELLYLIGYLTMYAIRTRFTIQARRTQGRRRDLKLPPLEGLLMMLWSIAMMGFPILYLLTSLLDFANYALADWIRWLGLAVFVLAAWLLWRSHADLGRQWSPTVELQQEHKLVTGGIYQRMRHPMYAAHLLWNIANALILPNWVAGWAGLLLFIPFYLLRAPREERMMTEQFGDAYREYKAHTGGLIPHF